MKVFRKLCHDKKKQVEEGRRGEERKVGKTTELGLQMAHMPGNSWMRNVTSCTQTPTTPDKTEYWKIAILRILIFHNDKSVLFSFTQN